MALDLHEWAPAAYAALLTTLLVSAATAVEAQAPDTTWRVSEITAPPSLARVDTVTGQSCDGAWPVCMPPPDGVAAGMVLVDDEVGGHEACAPVTNGSEVDGNIAVIARGTCEFGLKATNAQAAGAIAFVIYNHDQNPMETDSTFIFMGGAGTMNTIPGVFWARYIRNALLPSLEAGVPIEGRLDRVCRPEPCTVDLEPLPITESTVYAARPNPFTTTTEFGVQLVRTQHVTVEVFDTLGRRVALLHDGPLAAGPVHVFTLGAGRLPAGVYLYRVTGEDFVEANTVVLAR